MSAKQTDKTNICLLSSKTPYAKCGKIDIPFIFFCAATTAHSGTGIRGHSILKPSTDRGSGGTIRFQTPLLSFSGDLCLSKFLHFSIPQFAYAKMIVRKIL